MNKDIQTLIEREKPIERWLIEKGFDNEVVSRGRQLPYIYASDAIMMYIQEIALSLFKWRKVSEEDIPVDQIVILRLGDDYTLITITHEEIAEYANDKWKDGEWMPIPNIGD